MFLGSLTRHKVMTNYGFSRQTDLFEINANIPTSLLTVSILDPKETFLFPMCSNHD